MYDGHTTRDEREDAMMAALAICDDAHQRFDDGDITESEFDLAIDHAFDIEYQLPADRDYWIAVIEDVQAELDLFADPVEG